MAREWCEQCKFDSDLYNRADTISSQQILPHIFRAVIEGLDDAVLARRPDEATWSIGEYIKHVREVAALNRLAIEAVLESPGVDFGEPPAEPGVEPIQQSIDVERAFAGLERELHALRDLLSGLADEQWEATATLGGDAVPVDWFARHVLHDGLHHFADIGRIRHGFGHGATTETGTVTQVNVSTGGVPKTAIESAIVSPTGLFGDAQADRRHHGRPVQAVCLWSADVIAELAAAGHPIAAGNAGENITVAGIDWAALQPGARIDVGSVPMLISAHAIPCAKNAQWFADRNFNHILHDDNPGFSRLYAIPLGTGAIAAGDAVIVEP